MISGCCSFLTQRLRKTPVMALLLVSIRTLAQQPGYKEYFMEGSYQLLEDEPELALFNFKKAYEFDSSSANINYLLGIAYLQSEQEKHKAEYYLEKAVKNVSTHYKSDTYTEKAAPPLAHYYYGKALHFNYKFDQASKEFEAFKPSVNPKDIEYVKMLEKEEKNTGLAKQLINFPVNVKVTNLGEKINSKYPDYSAVLSGDERTIIFTTRRPDNSGGLKDSDGKAYEDIVVSYKDDNGNWSSPIPLGINTIGHEASINLSADGQTLIVYKNEAGGTNPAGNGNIYYTVFDGKDWAQLQEFGSDVNTEYVESHACLSSDGNVLFFSSERPGGFGGKDIYRCIKLPNGKWSKALNMGPAINSEYDEDGGFIHPDGQTFYFASNGPMSMGGFDILYATLNEDNKFSNVTNIGYPINTTDDDIFYVVSPDGRRGYFSSAKEQGGYGDKDIYQITLVENRETFLALFKGQIMPAEGESLPDNITIVVKDKETGELVGIYRPKPQNGTFSTILPPGKSYTFSYMIDGEQEFYNEEIFVSNEYAYQEIKREVNLEPVRIKGKIKVVQNTIQLSMQVLDNIRNKKPVSNARIILQEVGGGKQVFTTNEAGTTEKVLLTADRKYEISADLEQKKSEVIRFSTPSASVAQNLQQVVYLDQEVKLEISKEHLAALAVKHPKTKKPVPGAHVVLTDASGQKTEVETDEKGMVKDIQLIPDMKYTAMAYKDNFVSEPLTFSTTAANKAFHLNKTILLAYNPVTGTTTAQAEPQKENKPVQNKPQTADFNIRHPKTGRPVAGASVLLTDANGQKTELTSDEKGQIRGVELLPDMKYSVLAYKDEFASEPVAIRTGPASKTLRLHKNLLLAYNPAGTNLATARDSSGKRITTHHSYQWHFGYGKNTIDVTQESLIQFVNELAERVRENSTITVVINGSASQVPMRKAGGNPALAANRAENFKSLLLTMLEQKGVNTAGIKFELHSAVRGPAYQNDYIANRKLYEKYQYVNAALKP